MIDRPRKPLASRPTAQTSDPPKTGIRLGALPQHLRGPGEDDPLDRGAPGSAGDLERRRRVAVRLPVPRAWADGEHSWRASAAEKLDRSPTLLESLEALFDRVDTLVSDARRAERRLRAHGHREDAEAIRESVRRLSEVRKNTM
ncbi:MAG: hypothetical protein FJX78_08675 [Armatimonadetes bacterium]|nr:hypothetical protein [Armatimonadota bacterium]